MEPPKSKSGQKRSFEKKKSLPAPAMPKKPNVKRNKAKKSDEDMGNSNSGKQNSKIMFDDEGNTISSNQARKSHKSGGGYQNDSDVATKWYNEFASFNLNEELSEMKDAEILELTNTCKSCFEAEMSQLQRQNPSDAKWLQTALHKGTSKDRANAGALLVQSNPLANLTALEQLVGLAKVSNKTSATAVDVITELFMSALLTPNRKLLSLPLRGADWKALKKNTDVERSTRDRVLAYWHFEAELKEQYFEFLRNVQAAIQGNQDAQKNAAIICSSKLLNYSPEKEQMLLSMLVNKLGDPSNKVASKALHHLSEVAYRHPAMCEVIAKEVEKLLFRNNITEHAQHFALCFLSQIAPRGNADVCTRLVQICFSFFKIVVQKGAVNSKTMQAILRCLKRAIVDAAPADGERSDLLTPEIQDTMYRLVHLADIHITLQTLALLLQIMTVRSGAYDRFYNALYKKMLDINLVNIGPKAAAQFMHIVHRAIYMDANVARAQAFIKRLLQIAFYFPAQMTCGCLIVISKLLKARPELNKVRDENDDENDGEELKQTVSAAAAAAANDDSDGDEHYVDAPEEEADGAVAAADDDVSPAVVEETVAGNGRGRLQKYNPYHRAPAYAGAEYALRTELLALIRHFHPTVQVFAKSVLDNRRINFYGDPLRDFCLTQFLERFSFRNPKKADEQKPGASSLMQAVHHRTYKAYGGRGMPVQNLTKSNCSEEERFIFQYLEQKREKRAAFKKALGRKGGDDADDSDADSIDDDEFDEYLDGLGGKAANAGDDDEDLDFLKDLGDELKEDEGKKGNKQKKRANADDDDDGDNGDWDDGEDDDDDDEAIGDDDEMDSDDEGSVSLDGDDLDNEDDDDDDDDDGSDNLFEDDSEEEGGEGDSDEEEDGPPNRKKSKKIMSDKDFSKKLKNTSDMSSLFAAADDFAEMLEETGKSNTHGTLGDLFNKDKSSEKQMAWEQKRIHNTGSDRRGGGGGNGKGHYQGHKFKGNKNYQKNVTKKRKY